MIDFNWSMRTKMEEAVDEIVEGANENGETIVFTITIAKTEEGKIYLIPHAEHTVSNEDLLLTTNRHSKPMTSVVGRMWLKLQHFLNNNYKHKCPSCQSLYKPRLQQKNEIPCKRCWNI